MQNMLNPNREWKILKNEIFNNKPQEAPYPQNVVKRRELLLFAESFLAKYQSAVSLKYKDFFRDLYRSTMKAYFAW